MFGCKNMSEDSKSNQVASAAKRNVEELLNHPVLFPVSVGVTVKRTKIVKGKIIQLTDSGVVIKDTSGGLHNRPWGEIQGLKEDLDLFTVGVN